MEKSSRVMVLLDTNFLTLPQQFKIDIVEEIKYKIPNAELATIEPVVEELKKIPAGRVGLRMIERGLIKILPTNVDTKNTDGALLKCAMENKAVVCTNDRELRKVLKKNNVPVMYLRGRKKLEMEGIAE